VSGTCADGCLDPGLRREIVQVWVCRTGVGAMSFMKIIGLILVGLVGAVVYSCMPSSYSWHQKLTLEIETPSGLKVGSSVVYVIKSTQFVPGFGSKGSSGKRGEAVVLEVMPGKYLFALLKGQTHLAQKVFKVTGRGIKFKDWARTLSRLRGVSDVPEEHYPLMVTFTDINDPMSVKKVEPDDLEAHFGPGVKLKGMTLEMTGEAVTSGRVEQVLGWLGEYRNKLFDGRRIHTIYAENKLANSLGAGSFVAGSN